jgi:cyclase
MKVLMISLVVWGFTPLATRACSVARIPTPAQLVRGADIILHVIADRYVVPPPEGWVTSGEAPSIIQFQVVEVIKGDYGADILELHGYLSGRDDFNDGPVPYTFVRDNGRAGSCYANTYRENGHFLLLLKTQKGQITPCWAGLAPLNEQIQGSADPWLEWVRVALREPWTSEHFYFEELAPNVYAVISNDPLGLANHSNAVFIVGVDDVIVIDTQFTLHRTREVLAAIRKVTDKPVSVVINTHWHDDHTFGNQVYREAFPSVQIIAHANTKTDMGTVGVENRAGQVAGGPDAIAMFREAISKKMSLDGTAMNEDERAAYESTNAIAQEYLNDMPEFHLTLPTKTFENRLTIKRGDRTVEIRYFGPAVTRGDAVVYLPRERVLVAGDLVDNPLPFAYGCNVKGWIASLDSLLALKPRVIVPGHGEVMKNESQIRLLSSLLGAIQEQTRSAVARGETLEQARAGVNVGDFRTLIAENSKMTGYLFDAFFVRSVVGSAFEEVQSLAK